MNDVVEFDNKEKIEALVESAKNPQNAIRFKVTNEISERLNTDTVVEKRVEKTVEKTIDAGLTTVENEAQRAVHQSEKERLQAYFDAHKEELATAGIDSYTYLEDMERAVKWHKKCAKFHWVICGWWMTLIRTFILKAKPFKLLLNLIGILLNILFVGALVFGVIKIFQNF
jgi:hypothetical protein